jgi:hypothetical protein
MLCLHMNESPIGFDKWNITIKCSIKKGKKNNEAPEGINTTNLS